MARHPKLRATRAQRRMERETGIEPATNSLEGCDSTTELLPPSFTHFAPNAGEAGPPSFSNSRRSYSLIVALQLAPLAQDIRLDPRWPAMSEARRAESNGGEGRTRTFEAARATDLQSAAFDRFATSPAVCVFGEMLFP